MKKYNFKIYFFLLLSIVFVEANPAYAQKSSDKTIKILAIGNSFSQDAIEQYLWNIAQADSIDIVVFWRMFSRTTLEISDRKRQRLQLSQNCQWHKD